ncbi:MAG TPA: B12-binding domain-containing protein [Candidatus Limnocylindrales bacterium]|nr:B12-binding domain-containing protein [Candidatus Limnocylindrales bacterium]
MSDDLPMQLPPVDPRAAEAAAGASLSPELLAGLLADGDDELAAWAMRHALAEAPREAVFDGLVRDAMAIVGERWASGQWTVAEEHLASRTLLRALERVRPSLGPEHRVGPVAVLAGAAGEQHMIGLACLEQVLAEHGWTVANLGADLPAGDLGAFVGRNDVALVALSAADASLVGQLAESVREARGAAGGRRIPVLVGGMVTSHPGIAEAVEADRATRSITEALAFAESVRA